MNIEISNYEEKAKIFKALGDPTRLAMIDLLYRKKGELNCGDVAENFNTSRSTNTYHFHILREANLVTERKEGRYIFSELNLETFEKFLPQFLENL